MAYIGSDIVAEMLLDGYSFRTDMTSIRSRSDSTYYMSSTNPYVNIMDGTALNYAMALPDSTSLQKGHAYYVANDSTSAIFNVVSRSGIHLLTMYPRTRTKFTLKDNTTSNGLWIYDAAAASGGSAGYTFFGSYGGQASSGRYLEIYPGTDSSGSPYIVIGSFAIYALTIGTSALNTGTASIYKTSDLVNPISSISLTNESRKTLTGLFAPISSGDALAIKVSSGTFNKPYVTVYLTFAG